MKIDTGVRNDLHKLLDKMIDEDKAEGILQYCQTDNGRIKSDEYRLGLRTIKDKYYE